MSRYIDADAIYRSLGMSERDIEIAHMIEEAPSIDIVRCGECKKRKKNKFCLEYMRYEKNDEGFCSYGQKGDENVETD